MIDFKKAVAWQARFDKQRTVIVDQHGCGLPLAPGTPFRVDGLQFTVERCEIASGRCPRFDIAVGYQHLSEHEQAVGKRRLAAARAAASRGVK